jgi:hypothetical protein
VYVTLKYVAVTELKMLAGAILESLVPLDLERYRRNVAPQPRLSLGRFGEPSSAARGLSPPGAPWDEPGLLAVP